MRAVGRLLVATAAWAVAAAALGGQGYTPAAPQVAGDFVTGCAAEPARHVQSGVSLLLMLEPAEASRAFERAADADPDCASAEWGRALALVALPDARPAEAAQQRARAALARGRAAAHATPRERAYLDAAGRLFEPAGQPYLLRLTAFVRAMRALAAQDPQDRHAPLLVALGCLARSTIPEDMGQREAATAVALAYGDAPSDPAAATLLAAARDNDADAGSARAAAQAILAARPPAPRALLAAVRIFDRLGAWAQAAAAASAAIEVAGGVDAPLILDDSRWDGHPLPWLVSAEAKGGRFEEARRRLDAATARFAEMSASLDDVMVRRLRRAIHLAWLRLRWELVDWSVQPEWPDPALLAFERASAPAAPSETDAEQVQVDRVLAQRLAVEGLLAGRAAWPREEPERVAAARQASAGLAKLGARVPVPPWPELLRLHVLAALAASAEARDELALLLTQAAALDQQVRAGGEERGLVVDTNRLAGDLHAQLRDWTQAAASYRAAVHLQPGDTHAWLGLARTARRLGDDALAREAYGRVLKVWVNADPDRPEVAEAKRGATEALR